uniref:Uncharacterized protein n=1 Tax=Macaca fascicularis TaxID=9541 RepID=A0A7N9DBI1_MACFA
MVEGKEEQVTPYIDGSKKIERACAEKLPFLKLSALVRLIHYHNNSRGKTRPHDSIISHRVPPTTCENYGSYKMRIRWGHKAKPYHPPYSFQSKVTFYYSTLFNLRKDQKQ